MALYAKRCNKLAEAKTANPAKIDDAEQEEQWRIEQLMADHEQLVYLAFLDDTDMTTEDEAALLRK
eukprot:9311790-Heterocapsa_arctica.AAC.1